MGLDEEIINTELNSVGWIASSLEDRTTLMSPNGTVSKNATCVFWYTFVAV